MDFDFQHSTRVIFGEGRIDLLGGIARELGASRVLIVADPGIVRAGHIERAIQSLRDSSIESFVFSDVDENPTTTHVERGAAFAREHGPLDLIIGLGGGSAMDVAKGVNFLLTNGGKMEDYWGTDRATKPMLPSIGIPTTAGTGSEAQSYALISQESTHRKMACGDRKARFRAVILDPHLSVTMPQRVTAVTGLDAITHSIETYVSTKSNGVSQMFSREAWRLLNSNFETALQRPSDIRVRGNMLLGAFLAGMAIECSMLGAAHACANPLTAHFGTTHGIAVGVMLPHVIRFNGSRVSSKYAELLHIAGENCREADAAQRLSDRISALLDAAGIASNLRDHHVEAQSIPLLASEAEEQWTGKFNPVPVTRPDFVKLYESAY